VNSVPTRDDRYLRADAARNRAAILDAAARLFADRGLGVPMAEIAAAAGIGRTTLLRNYPTRMDLAVALVEQIMDRIRTLAASQSGSPDDFEALLDLKLDYYVNNGGLSQAMQKVFGPADSLNAERREVAEILFKAAQPAVRAGRLRDDVTVETFVILQNAIAGIMLTGKDLAERQVLAGQVRSLLLNGLRARPAEPRQMFDPEL
jgi:AcrR family transcriptional regulator